ncbi:2,4-dihydroxyhept-2-ene-1,7-dioic acid aldolase [Hyphomicrobiales bacterium]|nr:2,4-dihydroxyhept-2-ene-1,7-dioic acid aldolase [Hyphomicrobiales bacterium]CAH1689867.1 2,4-dihydroxyhept-2-ene-1,7-dioic acid aldolase [Hyphomicrobiales bacterium]
MKDLRAIWNAGGTVINAFISLPCAFSTEIMARAGFDSLVVDLQHGMLEFPDALASFQAMGAAGAVPLARIPELGSPLTGKLLDAGAAGLICPMIETADDVARFVADSLYPPAGRRSNGATRAVLYHEPGAYQKVANARVVLLPMIETAAALANVEAIAAVPGIAGLYVGPTDLAFSMGLEPRIDNTAPELMDAYAAVVAAAERNGIIAALHCGAPAFAREAVRMGFRMVTVNGDTGLLSGAAKSAVAIVRAEA